MRFDTKQFVAHVSSAVLITMLPMFAHLINMLSCSVFADETSATTVCCFAAGSIVLALCFLASPSFIFCSVFTSGSCSCASLSATCLSDVLPFSGSSHSLFLLYPPGFPPIKCASFRSKYACCLGGYGCPYPLQDRGFNPFGHGLPFLLQSLCST